MGLFDQILGAIDSTTQQGSSDQLSNILGSVEQIASNNNIDPATAQTALSIVGKYVKGSLQEQRETSGSEQVQATVNQFGGTTPNYQAVQALFTPELQQRIAQEISQRTGMNAQTIIAMLPMLVPGGAEFIKNWHEQSKFPDGGNPVLNGFLDADGDGDVDISDAMMLAGRYMNQAR